MATIALVEDNPDNQLLVRALLGDLYRLAVFDDAQACLDGLSRIGDVDLFLLDIALPGMDGVELLQRLRAVAAHVHTPMIALTAHAMHGDREKLLASGFDDYVSKPIVDERHLLEPVHMWLHRAKVST